MTVVDGHRPEPRPWLIMLSGSPWLVGAHRQHALAAQLASDYRVLFVDPPSNGVRRVFEVAAVAASIWHVRVPTPLPAGRQLPPVNRLTRRLTARELNRWLAAHPARRLLWIDEDLAAPLIGRLGEEAVVCDVTDLDWSFTRPWNRPHLKRALRSVVGRADLVLVSSTALPERLPASRHAPVVAPNACDPQPFRRPGAVPPWLAALPRPRLGYVGAIDTRALDAGLVAGAARRRPDWTFVLLGPATRRGRAALAGLGNVVVHDAVPHTDVPSVLAGFDVGLIPYRVGGLIDYVHPKKTYEYLAAGLPVVATPLPALVELAGAPELAGLVRLAATPAELVGEAEIALHQADDPIERARRHRAAAANSWTSRGRQVRDLLTRLGSPEPTGACGDHPGDQEVLA